MTGIRTAALRLRRVGQSRFVIAYSSITGISCRQGWRTLTGGTQQGNRGI